MRYFIFIGSFFIGLFSCKTTTKAIILEEYQGDKITFGTGGGFTGRVTSQILLPSGDMFKKADRSDNFIAMESISKRTATQMFFNFETLGLHRMNINDPGNQYYFISYLKDGNEHKLTWGGLDSKPDPNLKTYYQTLRSLVAKPKAQSK